MKMNRWISKATVCSGNAIAALALAGAVAGVLAGCAVTPSPAQQQLGSGFRAYRQHAYAQANQQAAAYLRADPHGSHADDAYYLQAITQQSQGQPMAAAANYRRAIATAHSGAVQRKSYFALGEMAFAAGQYGQAANDYGHAVAVNDGHPPVPMLLFRYGEALQAVGRWGPARQVLSRAAATAGAGPVAGWARQRLAARHFTVQFGAYDTPAAADALAQSLHQSNISAYVTNSEIGGRPMYLVQAGIFPNYAAAASMHSAWAQRFPGSLIEAQ